MPQLISSRLMSRCLPNAEIHNVYIIQKLKKCEVDLKKSGCSSKQGGRKQARDFCYDCENFAGIEKISQS